MGSFALITAPNFIKITKFKNEIMVKEMLIWLYYNTGRNTNLMANSEKICHEFNEATKGDNKYCKCQNKGKAVNEFWIDWHCTYCLKPKQQ